MQPALHQVSGQLKQECLPYVLCQNTFVFDLAILDPNTRAQPILTWSESLPDLQLSLVRDLVITTRASPGSKSLFTICFWGRTELMNTLNDQAAPNRWLGCTTFGDFTWQSQITFERYRQAMDELKECLRTMDWYLKLRNGCLWHEDIEHVATCAQGFIPSCIEPRWRKDFTLQIPTEQDEVRHIETEHISAEPKYKLLTLG